MSITVTFESSNIWTTWKTQKEAGDVLRAGQLGVAAGLGPGPRGEVKAEARAGG